MVVCRRFGVLPPKLDTGEGDGGWGWVDVGRDLIHKIHPLVKFQSHIPKKTIDEDEVLFT